MGLVGLDAGAGSDPDGLGQHAVPDRAIRLGAGHAAGVVSQEGTGPVVPGVYQGPDETFPGPLEPSDGPPAPAVAGHRRGALAPPRVVCVRRRWFSRGMSQDKVQPGRPALRGQEEDWTAIANNTVYLWPDQHRKKDLPPLVLRLVELHDGRKPVFLLTSVLDDTALSDPQAGMLYRMRWGVEVFYRSLKQTLTRRKMHSAAGPQAMCELSWAAMGLWGLSLMSLTSILAAGGDPLALSVATALRQVRLAIRCGPRSPKARLLLGRLHAAVKDSYVRRTSKKARDWPHKKKDKPPGLPRIQIATPKHLSQAKALYAKTKAINK